MGAPPAAAGFVAFACVLRWTVSRSTVFGATAGLVATGAVGAAGALAVVGASGVLVAVAVVAVVAGVFVVVTAAAADGLVGVAAGSPAKLRVVAARRVEARRRRVAFMRASL